MNRIPPSGEQFEISLGDQRATIVEVGGGVRTYSVGERPVLDPYPLEMMCDGAHGTPLIPWPNRLADGSYSFAGNDYRVALSEPERGNAIHGLLRWRSWRAIERQPERVVMGIVLHPMSGYPFALDVRVAYELDATGLNVVTSAVNVGDAACPFGAGQHPYLSGGGGLIDECTLQLDAATRILTDDERKLPTGRAPVEGTAFDFRRSRTLGEQQIDFAYADLARDSGGAARVRLGGPDGATVELWVDPRYRYLELYTGDDLAPGRRRRGLGAEPMTCPPNAFATCEDIVRLAPGESFSAAWGVRLV